MAPRELGGLTRQYLSFNGVLETTWKLFSDNMGVMFGVGAVFFGVNFALNILSNILAVGAQASGMIAIVIGAQFVNMAISFCVQTFMQIGGIVFGLNLIRTGRPNWSDVFAGGPHFVGGCLLSLAIGLINAAILLVCELPAIVLYIAQGPQQVQQQPEIVGTAAIIGVVVAAPIMILLLYRWIFAMPFLVDRRVGITEALQLSTQFTQGNKFTIFVIMLVVGILGTIIGILTCCLGFLGYISYFMVLMVVMYLQATGQMPVTALPPKLHPLQFPPGK